MALLLLASGLHPVLSGRSHGSAVPAASLEGLHVGGGSAYLFGADGRVCFATAQEASLLDLERSEREAPWRCGRYSIQGQRIRFLWRRECNLHTIELRGDPDGVWIGPTLYRRVGQAGSAGLP
jgi:hypothetical protein